MISGARKESLSVMIIALGDRSVKDVRRVEPLRRSGFGRTGPFEYRVRRAESLKIPAHTPS